MIPDPNYPTIETRLDINSRVALQLRYNPAYLEELAEDLQKFHAVITHLCLHILLDHPLRALKEEQRRGYYDDDVEPDPSKNLQRDIVSTGAADCVVNYYTMKQYKKPDNLKDDIGFLADDWGFDENLTFEE